MPLEVYTKVLHVLLPNFIILALVPASLLKACAWPTLHFGARRPLPVKASPKVKKDDISSLRQCDVGMRYCKLIVSLSALLSRFCCS